MKCPNCGHDDSPESHVVDPWCMYQVKDGKVINDLFLPHLIPEGWHDSPKAAKAAVEAKVEQPKPEPKIEAKVAVTKVDGRTKAGKALKAKTNDNSTRAD